MKTCPTAETDRWKVRIAEKEFDRFKTEERFWFLVTLARAVNAFRFVHSVLGPVQDDDSPSAMRTRYNSFLFNCALFAEAEILVQKLGQYFREVPTFQELSRVTNCPDARSLLKSSLRPLRNSLVFHFDAAETGEQLKTLSLAEPIFVSAMGATNGQTYYELADLCAMRTFCGSDFPAEESLDALRDLMKRMSNLTIDFLTTAEEFLVDVLERDGWEGVMVQAVDTSQGPGKI
jgi:hypothetical protein